MLQAVHREVSTHLRPSADLVRNHLHNFLIDLARSSHTSDTSPGIPAEYLSVRRHIERQYATSLTLRELAARVGRSVPRFAARYRELFGVSPIEHALHLRMQEARFLLRDRNLTVAQIADRLGYCNVQHFSRQFRNRFGISPSQTRP
jgi:AraC-like DNA-binding protein